MKWIKEFLKPNWWKIILLSLFLYTSKLWYVAEGFPIVCLGNMTGGCSPTGEKGIELCWDAYKISKPCFITNLFILAVGLYLLVCLSYFIIVKIKRLITKPK